MISVSCYHVASFRRSFISWLSMVVFSSHDGTVGAMKEEVEMKADLGDGLP